MSTFSVQLTNYLVKKCNINIQEALFIIEDECDYIEEIEISGSHTVESLAQELVDIYMVA